MLAMQYSVRLPTEYDVDRVNQRVSQRGPMFEGCPGLAHKYYLYDTEDHIYAPLYIWENGQAAQSFLMNNLFGDVVQDFGRPRVRMWQILDLGYGSDKGLPEYMRAETDKVCEKQSLQKLRSEETANHQRVLNSDGLAAHMVLLDPDRWEISRLSFWANKGNAFKSQADCVSEYNILQENRLLSGAA